jgi:hypothetical protein
VFYSGIRCCEYRFSGVLRNESIYQVKKEITVFGGH